MPKSLPPPHSGLTKSLARSTENFHTQTFGLASARRTPSYVHLNSGPSGEQEWTEQLTAVEERIGVLASRFLYERQDMFKQILHACKLTRGSCKPTHDVVFLRIQVVKERKKRQLAEGRIEALERSSRQLTQHYDSRIIELAKQVHNKQCLEFVGL